MGRYREYLELKCLMEVEGTDEVRDRLLVIQAYFLDQQKPLKFNPWETDNVVLEAEQGFEEVCATLEENGVHNPKGLSEWEFYSRLSYYQ